MNNFCQYTILNPVNGIKDFTCCPEYAQEKSKAGYIVTADIIKREVKHYSSGGVFYR